MPKNKKASPETLIVSVVLDFMGCNEETSEEEFARLSQELRAAIFNPLVFHECKMVHRIIPGSHIVLFDFGGIMPGSNLMDDQSREIIRFAEDHPSTLIAIISEFTFRNGVEPLLEELNLTQQPNIKCVKSFHEFPEWPRIILK